MEAKISKKSSCPVKNSKIGPNESWTREYEEVAKNAQKIHILGNLRLFCWLPLLNVGQTGHNCEDRARQGKTGQTRVIQGGTDPKQ